jgi:hypothetical protein
MYSGNISENINDSISLGEIYLKYTGFEKKGLPQWIK